MRQSGYLHGPHHDYETLSIPAYLPDTQDFPDFAHVDWQGAPVKCKVYTAVPHIALDTFDRRVCNQTEEHRSDSGLIGALLKQVYGLTRMSSEPSEIHNELIQARRIQTIDAVRTPFRRDFLRPVPSGGGLYPCEMYLVAGKSSMLPAGIFHYDPLHHWLEALSSEDRVTDVQLALAGPAASGELDFIVLLSCYFWKNAFKYGAFGYRLQGLDLGVAIGQWQEMLQWRGLQSDIAYQFVDHSLNALLGLDADYESVYVGIAVRASAGLRPLPPALIEQNVSAALSQTPTGHVRGRHSSAERPLREWPRAYALHKASLCQNTAEFISDVSLPAPTPPADARIALPAIDAHIDLEFARVRRQSARYAYGPGSLTLVELARIFAFASQGDRSDIHERTQTMPHLRIYCVANRVDQLPPGIYVYLKEEQALARIQSAVEMARLTEIMPPFVWQAASRACAQFYLVGSYPVGAGVYGDRWYRMLNMEAGIVLQRLYLAGAALALACDANLAFHAGKMGGYLRLGHAESVLAGFLVARKSHSSHIYEQPIL